MLFTSSFLDSHRAGSFQVLAAIRTYLFGQIYDFAGKIHTVNIAKGSFRFAPVNVSRNHIEKYRIDDLNSIAVPRLQLCRTRLFPTHHGAGCGIENYTDLIDREGLPVGPGAALVLAGVALAQ